MTACKRLLRPSLLPPPVPLAVRTVIVADLLVWNGATLQRTVTPVYIWGFWCHYRGLEPLIAVPLECSAQISQEAQLAGTVEISLLLPGAHYEPWPRPRRTTFNPPLNPARPFSRHEISWCGSVWLISQSTIEPAPSQHLRPRRNANSLLIYLQREHMLALRRRTPVLIGRTANGIISLADCRGLVDRAYC